MVLQTNNEWLSFSNRQLFFIHVSSFYLRSIFQLLVLLSFIQNEFHFSIRTKHSLSNLPFLLLKYFVLLRGCYKIKCKPRNNLLENFILIHTGTTENIFKENESILVFSLITSAFSRCDILVSLVLSKKCKLLGWCYNEGNECKNY